MKKVLILTLCSLFIASSTLLSGCNKREAINLNNENKVKQIALSSEKDNTVDLIVYFDSSTDDKKIEIGKDQRTIAKDELLGELIIQELIKGPSVKSNLKPILPRETRLLSFSIKDDVAFVNLSKEAQVTMTAFKEEATLRSLITSLTQLSSVKKVKIIIDNKDAEKLGGNFSILKPLGKDDILNARLK